MTEGNKQNRRRALCTNDENKDAGTIKLGKTNDHVMRSVVASQSGFINQPDVYGEAKGNSGTTDGAKEVKFSLREKVGGTWEHVIRTTNIVGDETDYFAELAGVLLMLTGVAGLGLTRSLVMAAMKRARRRSLFVIRRGFKPLAPQNTAG
ncbi:MAG: hypothetical protein AB8B58_07880 [Roseobacter sp.]